MIRKKPCGCASGPCGCGAKKSPAQLQRDIDHALAKRVPKLGVSRQQKQSMRELQQSRERYLQALGYAGNTPDQVRKYHAAIEEIDAKMRALKGGGAHSSMRAAHATKKAFDWAAFTEGAAFGFWASPYVSEVANLAEASRESGTDPQHRLLFMQAYRALSPGPGGNWERVMPDPAPAARAVAKKFTRAVKAQLTDEQLDEVASKFTAYDAGYYGAMQSQGEGVGWHDQRVRVDPPTGFAEDPRVSNAVYAAVNRGARAAGVRLPSR